MILDIALTGPGNKMLFITNLVPSLVDPYPAEREIRYSGIKRSAMTCAVKPEVQESCVRPFET